MLTLAHRGDRRAGRENSVAALVAACWLPGVDGVEFDVRASADGVPVLVHDEGLARVAGINVAVGDLTAAQLTDAGIGTLAAALAALPATAFLDVELKENVVGPVAPLVARSRGGAPAAAVLSSFDPSILEAAGHALPGWPRWLNAHTLGRAEIATAVALRCEAVAADYRGITPRTFAAAEHAGLRVVAWPVARRATRARLELLGVYAICAQGAGLRP